MISVCVVTLKGMEDYLKVLLHSLASKCQYVREIIVVKIDEPKDGLIHKWKEGAIDVYLYSCLLFPKKPPFRPHFAQMVCGHAFGLHRAIDIAKEEYVWMCDPDVFLLAELDQFYLRLFERHHVNIVGASHFNAANQSYGYFPCAINCMMVRDKLPDAEWLKGELYVQSGMLTKQRPSLLLPVDGKYLIPGLVKGRYEKFPNPAGIFDVGCNLWLWNHQLKGRWIGFYLDASLDFHNNTGTDELVYPLNYSAKFYQSNFGLQEDLGDLDLLYHRTQGSKSSGSDFLRLYELLFGAIEGR